MKNIKIYLSLIFMASIFGSCESFLDVSPESNESVDNYYSSYAQINVGLTGCYTGLRNPLQYEWMLTELRSDDSKQSTPTSTSATNYELNDLDMYVPSPSHAQIYNYWLSVYQNIRNINLVTSNLGIHYNASTGTNSTESVSYTITDAQRNKLGGEALFLRAYHYFNMVRLFGGVFIITEPSDPSDVKTTNRSSVDEVYKLIEADLNSAISMLPAQNQTAISSSDVGRANIWAAKALLAKVYLTLGNKTDAKTLLTDIMANSGYGMLTTSYADVFSIYNEMNKEIIFTVRYKAGGYGTGSPFANLFAPTSSGSSVVNGDGSGYNYPTLNLYNAFSSSDLRKNTNILKFGTSKYYVSKYLSPVMIKSDAENDWPVIRYTDVMLMMAEAVGYPDGISYINQTRARAGLTALPTTVDSQEKFITELANERRLEFAFENQRLFDLLRLGVFIPTMKAYYASEYSTHYGKYKPATPLADLQARITLEKSLLPIPQREIDTNSDIVIEQNSGY